MSDFSLKDPKVIKHGFLFKMGGSVKSWKRRYFILKDINLYYFKDQSLKENLGMIPIVDCVVTKEETGPDQPGFYFNLKLPDSSNAKRNDFLIAAETDKERSDWIAEINKVNVITVFGNDYYNALQVNPLNPGHFIPIPFFIVSAIEFIEENGLDNEGVYRLNGSAQKIDNMVTAINQNVNVKFNDINDTTGVIKMYLRKLRMPIFLFENYMPLKDITNLGSNTEAQIESLRKIVRSLPIPNYIFLDYFTKHMIKIKEHSDKNLMSTQALSVCFGPGLIWEEDSHDAYGESNVQQTICSLLIDNYEAIFSKAPLNAHIASGNQSFNILVQEQDLRYPYTLNAPKSSIVQKVIEDRYGWTICVYNDKWGCVHKNDLLDIDTTNKQDVHTLLRGLSQQTGKWILSPEDLSTIGMKCPEAVQLYQVLKQRLDPLRLRAGKY